MTYTITQAPDKTYAVSVDGYTIASGLTHAEVQDLLGELERVEAEMEATRRRYRNSEPGIGDAFSKPKEE